VVGSRNGFRAKEFHRHCDGHTHPLTLVQTTNGCVFGGFTPVKWESRVWNEKSSVKDNHWKGDDSMRNCLFTLRNPRGVPLWKFALRAGKKQSALCCDSVRRPGFGYGCMWVSDNCNKNRDNSTVYFGDTSDSVSRSREDDFLAGAHKFTVKEIKVFEIAD
jgi:hypothetical protein